MYLKCLLLLLFAIVKVYEELLLPGGTGETGRPAAADRAAPADGAGGLGASLCEARDEGGRAPPAAVAVGGARCTSGSVMPPGGRPRKTSSSSAQSPDTACLTSP